MLMFGHPGITLGAAALIAGAVYREPAGQDAGTSWFTKLSRRVDIRILLVGSMLPDIIDKPVGQFFFREAFSNGRIFSHTLLFLVVLTGIGFFLYKRYRQVWMLTLAAGTFSHLVLDAMWVAPATLFWPAMGFTFEKETLENWLWMIFRGAVSHPERAIPELIGLAVLVWFGVTLLFRKRVGAFFKHGYA
jgi:membrane-bound metal-dependent hydrolase YbcI (DUF457 family)